ncbi:MAG: endolytic transglycosylase MltG [Piscirickettsiaceae bacterium]|nr:endolytic transglycosylase MltG [Piscirickettsiaceae bacterium]
MRLFLSLILLLSISFIAGIYEYNRFLSTPLNIDQKGHVFTVKAGSNLQKVSKALQQNGLSEFHPYYLYIYGRLIEKAHLIKAGEYLILPNTTLPELLDQLVDGQVIQYPLTIVEGLTAQQLITIISNDSRLVSTLENTKLTTVMADINKPDNHGEGEFLPETYYFTAGMTDKEILNRAHKAMTLYLEKAWQNKAKNLPYKTSYDALIMASIIEKETGIAEERAEIAGVFVRRLNIGMRLQTDPTVIYGMGELYKGNIRRKDLRTDTPYNTYTRYGLPPTPIALPSKESIDAALHPAQGKSLYFVATGSEGRHAFSNTLTAHNKAVRKYQLKKK